MTTTQYLSLKVYLPCLTQRWHLPVPVPCHPPNSTTATLSLWSDDTAQEFQSTADKLVESSMLIARTCQQTTMAVQNGFQQLAKLARLQRRAIVSLQEIVEAQGMVSWLLCRALHARMQDASSFCCYADSV